jgi:hypothetical protein
LNRAQTLSCTIDHTPNGSSRHFKFLFFFQMTKSLDVAKTCGKIPGFILLGIGLTVPMIVHALTAGFLTLTFAVILFNDRIRKQRDRGSARISARMSQGFFFNWD